MANQPEKFTLPYSKEITSPANAINKKLVNEVFNMEVQSCLNTSEQVGYNQPINIVKLAQENGLSQKDLNGILESANINQNESVSQIAKDLARYAKNHPIDACMMDESFLGPKLKLHPDYSCNPEFPKMEKVLKLAIDLYAKANHINLNEINQTAYLSPSKINNLTKIIDDLGDNYTDQGKTQKGIETYKHALKLDKEFGSYNLVCDINDLYKYDKSTAFLKEAQSVYRQVVNKDEHSLFDHEYFISDYTRLEHIDEKLGDFKEAEQMKKLLDKLNKVYPPGQLID